MDLLVAWGLFPLALLAIYVGWGLLVRAAIGSELAPALVPGAGLAAVTCLGSLTTALDATAELTVPLALIGTLAGYALAWPLRVPAWESLWPGALAGAAVFLAYGAPVILSGEATFAGYIKLDDTSTWLALTDRVMDHGHSLAGLAPSTYEATLSAYLGTGYPTGAFLPLGIGSQVVFTDPAWTIQPYISLLAALLAASLAELAKPVVPRPAIRVGVGFLAAQPALLRRLCPLGRGEGGRGGGADRDFGDPDRPRARRARERTLPARTGPIGLGAARRSRRRRRRLACPDRPRRALSALAPLRDGRPAAAGVLGAAAAIFLFTVGGGVAKGIFTTLTSESELGNLIEPLSPWQAFGIWPTGDFRLSPDDPVLTAIAIAVAIGAGIAGLAAAVRRGLFPILSTAAAAIGCVALVMVGSPWVDGKALAIASPAILFAAALGVGSLFQTRRLTEAILATVVVAERPRLERPRLQRGRPCAPRPARRAGADRRGDRG